MSEPLGATRYRTPNGITSMGWECRPERDPHSIHPRALEGEDDKAQSGAPFLFCCLCVFRGKRKHVLGVEGASPCV